MAIRYVSWRVSEDTSVTPTVPQYGGVQGEHNATEIAFIIEVNGSLANSNYRYYIECVDAAGGYDRTKAITRRGAEISTLVPLAWTQYGGISTVRLIIEEEGVTLYSIEGRLQFADRGTAADKVDGLLRTDLTEMLDACRAAADDCTDTLDDCRGVLTDCRATADDCTDTLDDCRGVLTDCRTTARETDAIRQQVEAQIDALPVVSSDVTGDTIWSSRYMADTLCPLIDERADTVVCHPLHNYPLSVTAYHANLLRGDRPVGETVENGLTFTRAADGSVTVNGTATANTYYYTVNTDGAHSPLTGTVALGEKVLLNGCPAGGGQWTYHVFCQAEEPLGSTVSPVTYRRIDTGGGNPFHTVAHDYDPDVVWTGGIFIGEGTVLNDLRFTPRLSRTDDLQLIAQSATRTEVKPVTPYQAIEVSAHGGEMQFSASDGGSVHVYGRADPAAYCGDIDRALDGILALQSSLLGGEGV